MKILDDLLSALKYDAPVRDIRQGPFQTAVMTRNCGLAATLRDRDHAHGEAAVKEAGHLLGRSCGELARMAYSPSLLEASIGMAAVNSLIEVDVDSCVELNAADLLLERGEGKKVAIVGHFPFVTKLRQMVDQLWVIEKRPREGDFPEDEAERLLPQAKVIGITGTAFTNHTIEYLLKLCHPESYVVILGGTAPLSSVLFDYGIDAVSGTKVVHPEKVLNCVSQGATFRQIQGVRLLTMKRR
jgi:uncharacterized protein (DUF4213/DUF364 family)